MQDYNKTIERRMETVMGETNQEIERGVVLCRVWQLLPQEKHVR